MQDQFEAVQADEREGQPAHRERLPAVFGEIVDAVVLHRHQSSEHRREDRGRFRSRLHAEAEQAEDTTHVHDGRLVADEEQSDPVAVAREDKPIADRQSDVRLHISRGSGTCAASEERGC